MTYILFQIDDWKHIQFLLQKFDTSNFHTKLSLLNGRLIPDLSDEKTWIDTDLRSSDTCIGNDRRKTDRATLRRRPKLPLFSHNWKSSRHQSWKEFRPALFLQEAEFWHGAGKLLKLDANPIYSRDTCNL